MENAVFEVEIEDDKTHLAIFQYLQQLGLHFKFYFKKNDRKNI